MPFQFYVSTNISNFHLCLKSDYFSFVLKYVISSPRLISFPDSKNLTAIQFFSQAPSEVIFSFYKYTQFPLRLITNLIQCISCIYQHYFFCKICKLCVCLHSIFCWRVERAASLTSSWSTDEDFIQFCTFMEEIWDFYFLNSTFRNSDHFNLDFNSEERNAERPSCNYLNPFFLIL